MKTVSSKTLISRSPEETHALGRKLGEVLSPGAVLYLTGDLGSGKTMFVKGLALGLGVPDTCYVTSPTYTLINEYQGKCPLYHLDLYRIGDSSEIFDLGIEEMAESGGVMVIEWPDRLPDDFVAPDIRICIEVLSDDSRNIILLISDMDLKFQI